MVVVVVVVVVVVDICRFICMSREKVLLCLTRKRERERKTDWTIESESEAIQRLLFRMCVPISVVFPAKLADKQRQFWICLKESLQLSAMQTCCQWLCMCVCVWVCVSSKRSRRRFYLVWIKKSELHGIFVLTGSGCLPVVRSLSLGWLFVGSFLSLFFLFLFS